MTFAELPLGARFQVLDHNGQQGSREYRKVDDNKYQILSQHTHPYLRELTESVIHTWCHNWALQCRHIRPENMS